MVFEQSSLLLYLLVGCSCFVYKTCFLFYYRLKGCEPEFLVSTPERLLELVSLKAIDISGVSLLASTLSFNPFMYK